MRGSEDFIKMVEECGEFCRVGLGKKKEKTGWGTFTLI